MGKIIVQHFNFVYCFAYRVGPIGSAVIRCSQCAEVRDRDGGFGETRGDFQRTPQRFDVAPEIAHVHVRPALKPRHRWLPDMQVARQINLRLFARMTQLMQRHFTEQLPGRFCIPRSARG